MTAESPTRVEAVKKECPIKAEPDIVLARQAARELAQQMGFRAVLCIWIATVVSELSRNIYVYAKEGVIEIRAVVIEGRMCLEITARDHGPGIENIELAMTDGYSTIRSMGMGLPGSKRLMDELHVESKVGEGTTVTARKWLQ